MDKEKLFNELLKEQIKIRDKELDELKNCWQELRAWIVCNKHNENTREHYLVVDYGTLLGKMNELEGKIKNENRNI